MEPTQGGMGESPMESVGGVSRDAPMDIITNVGAIISGVLMVGVGGFSIAAIWFEDLS